MPTIAWTRNVPTGYNTKLQRTQFIEAGEAITFPSDKYWSNPLGEYTVEQAMNHGMTQITQADAADKIPSGQLQAFLDAKKTFYAMPRIEHIMDLHPSGPEEWLVSPNGTLYNKQYWPNGPLNQTQAEQKGDMADIRDFLFVGEYVEGNSWISPTDPMWKWYHDRVNQRRTARFGSGHLYAHNYFTLSPWGGTNYDFWNLGFLTRQQHKDKINRPANQYEPSVFSPGATLSGTTCMALGIYLNEPDTVLQEVIRMIHRALIIRKMGYKIATIYFDQYEWRPNNWASITYPQEIYPGDGNYGDWFRSEKITMPPSNAIAYGFFGSLYGDFCYEWGGSGKETTPKVNHGWYQSDLFNKNFAMPFGTYTDQYLGQDNTYHASQFNYYQQPGERYRTRIGSNFFPFGMNLYGRTFAKTHGGTDHYCPFRLDNGSWLTPQSLETDEIIDSFFDKRAFVRAQRKDGKIALVYYNQAAPNVKRTIEIQHPTISGRTYTAPVFGSGVHAVLLDE